MLLAGAPLAAPEVQALRREIANGVIGNRMARTRRGGRRVRNGPRRACAGVGGEATLRALAFAQLWICTRSRVPEVSLRRRRVLLVAARSSPCGAAWGNVRLAMYYLLRGI